MEIGYVWYLDYFVNGLININHSKMLPDRENYAIIRASVHREKVQIRHDWFSQKKNKNLSTVFDKTIDYTKRKISADSFDLNV